MARVLVALTAFACGLTGIGVAWHYPVAPPVAVALFLAWIACSFCWPAAWLAVIPALLPVTGFATWTGWFAFEELDLLVLGAAAGGYAKRTYERHGGAASQWTKDQAGLPSWMYFVVGPLAISYGIALYRGIADAGGFQFDWIGSYDSAMNSVRIAKSFAAALLLWPLMRGELDAKGIRAINLLVLGIVSGLCLASISVLWERAAFTDLLNFSSDYRTTAMFWEMHVGGAALDGYLALTTPFIICEFRRSTNLRRVCFALGLAALATYACLTTFSRGVYVAVPVGLATVGVLLLTRRPASRAMGMSTTGLRTIGLAIASIIAVYLVFRHGGYRALLAFVVTASFAFWLAPNAKEATLKQWVVGAIGGLTTGAVLSAIAMTIPKGPYALFGLIFVGNAFLVGLGDAPEAPRMTMRLGAFVMLVVTAAAVALHWGGVDAFTDSALALALLLGLTLWSAVSEVPLFPVELRSRIVAIATLCFLGGAVAVFTGGAYMSDRFSTSTEDLDLRLKHWRDSIGMLQTGSDWWLGKGLGRFPADYFFHVTDSSHPGGVSLRSEGGGRYMRLAGPRYETSWGDLFRIAQRVPPLSGKYTAILEVRSSAATQLHLEVCEQHLLYNGACAIASTVPRPEPAWQRIAVVMDGARITEGPWYAPRLAFFSMAVDTSGQAIDIRNVRLIGPDGNNLIANGDFSAGMARWIPISERYHLPWHAKSLPLNMLFDQGLTGLAAFLLVLGVALWRLTLGKARNHSLAPFIAASLVGFVAVGAFDSLLDVPRVAFLFYVLVLAGLSLESEGAADVTRSRMRASAH